MNQMNQEEVQAVVRAYFLPQSPAGEMDEMGRDETE